MMIRKRARPRGSEALSACGLRVVTLSPAYDLFCTRLVVADDLLSLSIDGNKRDVTRRQWMTYAAHCKLPPRAAERVLREVAAAIEDCASIIARSALPAEMKTDYAALIRKRGAALTK